MSEWNQHVPVVEWVAILDGNCPADVRRKVVTHLAECPGCRLFHGEMQAVHDALRRKGAALASHEGEASAEAALSKVLFALRLGRSGTRSSVDERLASVVEAITPFFGAQGVENTIAAARKSLRLEGRAAVPEERWPEFLRFITAIAALMCGDTAAELAWVAGME